MKTKSSTRTTALAMLTASAMMLGMPTMAAYNQPIGSPTGGNAAIEFIAALENVQKQLMLIQKRQLEKRAIAIINANQAPVTGAVPMPNMPMMPRPMMMPNVPMMPRPMMMPNVSMMPSPMMMPNVPMMPSGSFVAPGCGSFTRHCAACQGSGSCKICYGTGRVTGGYGGERRDCTACNGTGRCTLCGN